VVLGKGGFSQEIQEFFCKKLIDIEIDILGQHFFEVPIID